MNPAEEEDVVGEEERRSDGGGVEEAQAEPMAVRTVILNSVVANLDLMVMSSI
jgi:hypothetical protein